MEYWIWTAVIAAMIGFFHLLHQRRNKNKNKKKLPPGPHGLPIIGYFHLLSKNPHQDLHRLAQKHGPIMYIRLGSVPTIIASSPSTAELFLKTHDLIFADRPYQEGAYNLSYRRRNIAFGSYSPYWRNMRKLCTLELLSSLKIAQFEAIRNAEIGILAASLRTAAAARETVDLSMRISSASADMTCLMVFGRKFVDRDLDKELGFKEVMAEMMAVVAAFNVGDYFPYLRWLDLVEGKLAVMKLEAVRMHAMEHIDNIA